MIRKVLCIVVLAAAASPYKAIGLKPKRTISLMNGSIPCKLLLFDLYSGTRRTSREGGVSGLQVKEPNNAMQPTCEDARG